jgi:hypothetical protein
VVDVGSDRVQGWIDGHRAARAGAGLNCGVVGGDERTRACAGEIDPAGVAVEPVGCPGITEAHGVPCGAEPFDTEVCSVERLKGDSAFVEVDLQFVVALARHAGLMAEHLSQQSGNVAAEGGPGKV